MSALDRAISSQPAILERVLELDINHAVQRLAQSENVILVGTGTSQHAAEIGAEMFRLSGRKATAESSAAFTRRSAEVARGDAIVVISHTGETSFARDAMRQALAAGATLLPITGHGVGWPHALEVAPREQSETYTASYTAGLLTLARLAGSIGAPGLEGESLSGVPDAVRAALDAQIPDLDPESRVTVIAGFGIGATTAREGALKLREAARVIAEGYEGEYLLHGSAVPLGRADTLILLQPRNDPDGLLLKLGAAAERAGVTVREVSDDSLADPVLQQIPLTVRLQRIAGALAAARGQDPDTVIIGSWADEGLWAAGHNPDDD